MHSYFLSLSSSICVYRWVRADLEKAVIVCIQGALELLHVPKLLRVDVLVREVHRDLIELELHGEAPLVVGVLT
jgi:hypothetical protein